MFTRKDLLIRKTGEDGVGRYDFLKQLINEFTTTKSSEGKRQTLANLSNFAYDPVNYEYIKQLHIIDLFLAQLSEDSEELTHFALAGLCNISCDPESQEYIISLNGISLIFKYVLHKNEEMSLNSLTTLYYLLESDNARRPDKLLEKVKNYTQKPSPRLRNLALVFLEKYFPEEYPK